MKELESIELAPSLVDLDRCETRYQLEMPPLKV